MFTRRYVRVLLLACCALLALLLVQRHQQAAPQSYVDQAAAFTTVAYQPPVPTPIASSTEDPVLAPDVVEVAVPLVVNSRPQSDTPGQVLRVHFIDVGQGDSIFIQTPDGTTALIDGGYDNGAALAYLQQQGVQRIDVMLASHPHADHIGGLVEVLRTLPVGAVWTSGATHTTATFERFVDTIAAARVPYHEAQTGDTIPLGALAFQVLHSDPRASNLNDTSLVVRLAYGDVSFLFTGDAEQRSETKMLTTNRRALGENALGASGCATEELTNVQNKSNGIATPRYVSRHTGIPAMDCGR